jgi:hypothetical protein
MVHWVWMTLLSDLEWLAQSGLTAILMMLLGFGVALLLFGFRDLIKDAWNFYLRLHKNSH